MNKITKHKKWLIGAIIAIICISYGLTTKMYFWQDDSALIFRLQHPVGPMGSFGPSIWADRGAYRYMVIPFVPFYPVFGLNPSGYFLIGLITYAIATWVFWFFVREFTKSDWYAAVATTVFAAGYLGSDMMFRIINSWQSNTGLILSLISLTFYARYINNSKIRSYLLALLFYFLTIELVYIRSHSLVASIGILELAFTNIRSLKNSFIRLIPFVLLFYLWYFRDPSFGSPDLPNIAMLSSYFATLGNTFVPNVIQIAFTAWASDGVVIALIAVSTFVFGSILMSITHRKRLLLLAILGSVGIVFVNYLVFIQSYYWYRSEDIFISSTIGALIAYHMLIISLLSWKKREGKILFVGLVFLMSQIFGYFMQYPTAVFATTHRYLFFAIIGYSIVVVILPTFLGKKATLFFVGVLVFTNLVLSQQYQQSLLVNRSIPSRQFYTTLLNDVPSVESGSIFFFDIQADPFYQHQFADFFSVGSMPESTALAIYYGLDRDEITFLTDYDELVSLVAQSTHLLDKTYTFFYGERGLVNTTNVTRTILMSGSLAENGVAPGYLEVEFDANIIINQEELSRVPVGDQTYTQELLSYYMGLKHYYQNSQMDSLSEWKFQEKEYAIDRDSQTSWRGHRIYWDDNEHDALTVDLSAVSSVSRVIWENWIPSLTPTVYTIETSLDGMTWDIAKNVHNSQKLSGDVVEVRFEPRIARYVKMSIDETVTNDSPAISEIKVIESKYDALSLSTINSFMKNPFSYTNTPPPDLFHIVVEVTTDRGVTQNVIPVRKYGTEHYRSALFVGGTKILDVKTRISDPLDIDTFNIKTKNLSLDALKNQKLIKRFSVN